jgi:hypothetical protein
MRNLIRAITELLEAKAELLREEAAMLHLGKFAEGYQAGQEDLMEHVEVVYTSEDGSPEDD